MSKAVKAVAGVALAFYAPVLVAGFAGSAGVAFTAMGYYATVGAITLVGASLAGSALAPDMPDMEGADSYAGQKLQTRKDNVSAVPVIFGENRVGSNIIWQGSSAVESGQDNKDYWSIQVVGDGEIENYLELYKGEETLEDKGSNVFTSEYVQVKAYETSGDTAMAIKDVNFVRKEDGTLIGGGDLNASQPYTITASQLSHGKDSAGEGLISWNPDKLVDQSYSWEEFNGGARFREWQTTEDVWIQIDLTQAEVVASLGVYIGQNALWVSGSVKAQYYNGSSWTDASTVYGFYNGDDGAYNVGLLNLEITESTPYSQWRLYFPSVTCSGNNVRLFEVEMSTEAITAPMSIPANVSFIATHQIFDANNNNHTQLDNITAKIQGKKVRSIGASSFGSEVYSNNPAEQVADILTNGLNISDVDIDFTTFYNARNKCNDYGYNSNIVFNNQRNIQSVIKDVLATCRGQIVFSQGKWKLKIDEKSATVVKALDSDDILNSSLNISMKGFQEIANKIDLKYINPNDNWLSAKVEKQDPDLINMDGQTITKTLDVKGCTSTAQANKLAEITLNSIRYTEDDEGNRIKQTPLAIGFATTVKNAELEVGDIISLDHDLLDRVRKFVILSVETDQSGVIQVSAREYCETHYKDSANNYII